MKTKINGKVTTVFGNDINTDDIIRADVLQESTDKEFFAQYAFEKYDSEFINRCKTAKSNVVIAGENFGCGSSREHAVYALTYNAVNIVIAKSFPDIFYRNSINNGLILVRFEDIDKFKNGDEVEVDLDKKEISCNGKIYSFEAPDDEIFIMKNGGQLGVVKNYIENKEIKIVKKEENKTGGQTMVEKIISNHVGEKVFAGDKASAMPIDLIYLNEVIAPASITYFLHDFGGDAPVGDKNGIFLIPDHTVPSSSIQVSIGINMMKKFAEKHGVKMFKEGRGIEHIVGIEEGYVLPGNIILGTDSHTCTNGAMNCFSIGAGTTDAEYAIASGAMFNVEVPESIRINLTGELQKGVYAKDIVLELLRIFGAGGASKRVMEFHGEGVSSLGMDARTTIANMAVEMSARTAIFAYDEEVEKNIKNPKYEYKKIEADEDAEYSDVVEINLSELEPNVAFPHKPANVCKIVDLEKQIEKSQEVDSLDFPAVKKEDTKINECFLGACTNGKYDDMVVAAKILKGRNIHDDVTFVIIPASDEIYKKCLKNGIIETFVEAGALVESPNCGKCFGKHMGVTGPTGRIMSTSNRNYKGRMGAAEAFIFLASPASVAASAVAGEIVDPREYL